MESSNPILNRYGRGYASMETGSDQDLEQLYNAPAASSIRTGRLTIDGVVTRTALLFGLLVISGGVAWTLDFGQGPLMISLFAALGLSLVISFSRKVRPALVIAYAVLEGVVLGTLSNFYNQAYPGIVVQAVIASLAAFAGILFAYSTGRIRFSARATRIAMGALIGYLVLGIVSLFMGGSIYNSAFGPLIAIFGVGLASFFLALDFDQINKAVAAGVPQEESWRLGFGLMVSLVWLYLEVLRLLSLLRNDR